MLSKTLTLWVGIWLLATFAGCDRNIEDFKPGEEASPPDLARIFPAPAGGVGSAAGAQENAEAGDGATPRAAFPPSRTEARTDAPTQPRPGERAGAAGSSAPIAGTIEIASDLADSAPAGSILFVIARPEGARGGPPLAVVRIAEPRFPLSFAIGPEDVMIPSMQFAGPISLSARLDADGNAMTRSAGDISSAVAASLAPGAEGVRLVLSETGQ